MRKARTYKYLVGICAAVLFAACVIAAPSRKVARANSALVTWEGISGAGTTVIYDDCPLEVEREKLVFDISAFPPYRQEYGEGRSATVTAEYAFCNSENFAVTAKLAFPFGTIPYYGWGSEEWAQSGCGVAVDETLIESAFRYTYTPKGTFDYKAAVPLLRDDYVVDEIFSSDLPVYAYTYGFSDILPSEDVAYAAFAISDIPIILQADSCGYVSRENEAGVRVKNGGEATVFSIGVPLENTIIWNFYSYSPYWERAWDRPNKIKISGEATLTKTKELTVEELIFRYYDAARGITQRDWHNIVTESLKDNEMGSCVYFENSLMVPDGSIMAWCEYELSVPPCSKIVNKVKAPIYPDIDSGWNPCEYDYRYLLSPAEAWRDFGGIDVEIRTPFYLSDGYGFLSEEPGVFSYSADYLPDEDIFFTLCESQAPVRSECNLVHGGAKSGNITPFLIMISVIVALPIVSVFICLGVSGYLDKKRKAKKIIK